MLCSYIIAVCSETRMKYTRTVGGQNEEFFARSQYCEKRLLGASCLSIRPSVSFSSWNNLSLTGLLFMKFAICVYF
jgi:hypothetical protein